MATRNTKEDHDRSAAGMDFDSPMRERAAALGQTLADNGPQALFDELENLLPNEWRDQIRAFPLAAVILGVGAGVYLGMRKGDELLAAGTSMLSAAAMANVSRIMDRGRG
jgi:hypothetical protein